MSYDGWTPGQADKLRYRRLFDERLRIQEAWEAAQRAIVTGASVEEIGELVNVAAAIPQVAERVGHTVENTAHFPVRHNLQGVEHAEKG